MPRSKHDTSNKTRTRDRSLKLILAITLLTLLAGAETAQERAAKDSSSAKLRTLFIIGDSTVNNSSENFQGWGNVIGEMFDRSKINVVNRARGGRSSRTFQTEGLWDQVLSEMKSGDFLLIQFGHNDGGPLDRERARGSLRGTGEDVKEITIEATGRQETVHTFGWYMRKYVTDAKTKGVSSIILSPVPRNVWKDGKVVRASGDYGLWAKETAASTGAFFVDLNELTAAKYDEEGEEKVAAYFTTKDHTHTSPAGARMNADSVIVGLKSLKKLPLKKFLAKTAASASK